MNGPGVRIQKIRAGNICKKAKTLHEQCLVPLLIYVERVDAPSPEEEDTHTEQTYEDRDQGIRRDHGNRV
jgi:hypothetical protein